MARVAERVRGFGYDPADSPFYFVLVPSGENVRLEERHSMLGERPKRTVRAILDAYRWSRIEGPAKHEFNARLLQAGLPSASWREGETTLASHFGKELVLLAWVVEDADPTLIPNMVANWRGLAPEERWWFYTTINATSGHPQHGRDRGWRKAIKVALAENPAVMVIGTEPTPQAGSPARRSSRSKNPDGQLLLLPED